MEEFRASQPLSPGALARHVPGIMLRVSSGAGDYSQTFTARVRTDVLDLLDGIRFLSAALVRRTLEGNVLAGQLRARGHRTEAVYPDRSLYAVLGCDEEGAELSGEMLDIIFRRTLTDHGDSQVHRDRQAAVKIIAGLGDDLSWVDARIEGFSKRLGLAAPQAETSSVLLKDLLSSALSSDPGNTTVHLGGCYVSPLVELLEAVESGTSGDALTPFVQQVVVMEEALANHARSRTAARRR